MTWTSHGHHISGTVLEIVQPFRRAQCGGPRLCPQCKLEAKYVQEDQTKESNMDISLIARSLVQDHYNNDPIHALGKDKLEFEDVYIVWFAKTLQNWKALIGTTRIDDLYYEVTYNGDRDEAYIDVYEKQHNVKVKKIKAMADQIV